MNREERAALMIHIVDACVQAARERGYSDASGVLRGKLFLSKEPMSLDDLVDETGYSKSTVSSNMNILERLGMARRIITPGDKKYRYVCVNDPDALRATMMHNIKREIGSVLAALDLTERDLEAEDVDARDIREKIESIRKFYLHTETLLDIMAEYTTEEIIDILQRSRKTEER